MKKRIRRGNGPRLIQLVPLLHCYLVILAVLFARQIFIIIFLGAKALKWFTVPLLILYLTLLAAIGAALWWCKERIQLIALMGEELFYEEYPFDRWVQEKRKAWRTKKTAKIAKEQYDA